MKTLSAVLLGFVAFYSLQVAADVCPGYWDSSSYCCLTDDPCGWADDDFCDCNGTCSWDSADCGGSNSEYCPGYTGLSSCCTQADSCDYAADGYCDCDGMCDWDSADCGGSSSDYCAGYTGSSYCCADDDPCGYASDDLCDCDGMCAWDASDCGGTGSTDEYPIACNGSQTPSGTDCGIYDDLGCCDDLGRVVYCQDGALYCIDCKTNLPSCGWSADNGYYDCGTDGLPGTAPMTCGGGSSCTPSCTGKVCGDDGCGGTCGSCLAGQACQNYQCVTTATGEYPDVCNGFEAPSGASCGSYDETGCCDSQGRVVFCYENQLYCGDCIGLDAASCGWNAEYAYYDCGTDGLEGDSSMVCPGEVGCLASCTGRECGSDGCGGFCGTCAADQTCVNYLCVATNVCTPNCTGKVCGADGCGGDCGYCNTLQTCQSGHCVDNPEECTPDCGASVCGDDGCGGVCGYCNTLQTCQEGQCINNSAQEECTPTCAGKQCGADGCGGDCGTCDADQTCSSSGLCIDDSTPTPDVEADPETPAVADTCPEGYTRIFGRCVMDASGMEESAATSSGCSSTDAATIPWPLLPILLAAVWLRRRSRPVPIREP